MGLGAGAMGLSGAALGQERPKIPGFEEEPVDPEASKKWKPFSDRKVRVGIVGYGTCRFGAAFSFQDHPNVDVVAVSIMTSGQLHIAENLIPKLKAKGMDDALVIFGGTIPPVDFEPMQEMGVHRVFPAGLPGGVVADFIRENVGRLSLA